jgi:hypothetical protein
LDDVSFKAKRSKTRLYRVPMLKRTTKNIKKSSKEKPHVVVIEINKTVGNALSLTNGLQEGSPAGQLRTLIVLRFYLNSLVYCTVQSVGKLPVQPHLSPMFDSRPHCTMYIHV